MKKLIFIVNVDWFFVSHRLPIALAAQKNGYEIHLACAFTDKKEYLSALGIILHEIPFSRSGRGILHEVKTIFAIRLLLAALQPNIIHAVTIKPVLYSGIAAKSLGLKKMVAAVSGLGTVFIAAGFKAKAQRMLVTKLYRIAFSLSNIKVIFQNSSDQAILAKSVKLPPSQCAMIKGSGVNLFEYSASPEPDGIPIVVMASRLLKEKGVYDFVAAAENLKNNGVNARFILVGEPDPGNPGSVSDIDIQRWRSANFIEVLGFSTNIAAVFSNSHIVVLPSFYGEGLPKVLIEAAACGRAIITTNSPGCADAVINGSTGLVIPAKDIDALTKAIEYLLRESEIRKNMGMAGRKFAEKEFNIENVIQRHLEIYRELEMAKT